MAHKNGDMTGMAKTMHEEQLQANTKNEPPQQNELEIKMKMEEPANAKQ